jgi:flagellin-like hook-associated protein FlgL
MTRIADRNGFFIGSQTFRTAADAFVDQNALQDVLYRQARTQKIADTFGGLGGAAANSVNLNARISDITAYDGVISIGKSSISIANSSVESFSASAAKLKNEILFIGKGGNADGRLTAQNVVKERLGLMIEMLNTNDTSTYVFGGKESNTPPVITKEEMLDGAAGRAGLRQLVTERRQADLGADTLGRTAITQVDEVVSLGETVAGLPFGFKIQGVTSTLDNTTVTGPTGTPPVVSAEFLGTGSPGVGQTFTVKLGLPDGSSKDVELKVGLTPISGDFTPGATPLETADNFRAALTDKIRFTAETALAGASALATSQDFFTGIVARPLQRVPGPNFAAATAFAAATPVNTTVWYKGTDTATDPRQDRLLVASQRVKVGIGVRANEAGFQKTFAALGAVLASEFSTTETTAIAQFNDGRERAVIAISAAIPSVEAVILSLGTSKALVEDVEKNNVTTKEIINQALDDVEGVSLQETSVKLLTVQNQIDLTYKISSTIFKLSFSQYL